MKTRQPLRSSDAPINLTPKQANIYVWGFQPEARFRDAVCGRRFGKTFLGKAEMRRAARLAMQWGVSVEDEIWYAAPTQKQARRVFWRRLKQAIPESWRAGKPNETDMLIELRSGHLLRCVGLENYDDLRGSGLFFVLVDEWADCKYAAWEEVLRPMLSTCSYQLPTGERRKGGHALRIGTPKGFNHCYDTYLDGKADGEPDHRSWLYTSLDGGNVPPEEIAAARRGMDPRTFRQEYEASFESYSGVVYYTFSREACRTHERIRPGEALHVGVDFNVQKMSAAVFVIRAGQPLALDELHSMRDTPELIERLQQRFQGHSIAVYPDASGQNTSSKNASESDLSLLRKAGFTVVVDSTNPAVKDRINAVNSMLLNSYGERRLLINIDQCPKLTQCLERQVYTDKGDPDKAGGFDHMNDAAGYFIAKRYPIRHAMAQTQPLRI